MREVNVILRPPRSKKRIEILGETAIARLGESVVWHFTSLDPKAKVAEISFKNKKDGGHFFRQRGKKPCAERSVELNEGRGHTLGVAPTDPTKLRSRSEKYTIAFYDRVYKPGQRKTAIAKKDPEVIVGRP